MKKAFRKAVRQVTDSVIRGGKIIYYFARVQKPVTFLLGPLFTRAVDKLEIDITYLCNLRCMNCNRSVGSKQAPVNDGMSLSQIEKFIGESIENQYAWTRLRLIGGEPTLHPQFLEIVDLLLDYIHRHSPKTTLEVSTNNYGEKVKNLLAKLPGEVRINLSTKTSTINNFYPFNAAPEDDLRYLSADFTCACFVTQECGTGLTPYGYYACAIMGSIDRIFGFDLARRKLPSRRDTMDDQKRIFCRLCGSFRRGGMFDLFSVTHQAIQSKRWLDAYMDYHANPKVLSRY